MRRSNSSVPPRRTAVDVTDPSAPHAIWQGAITSHGMSLSEDGNRGYIADPGGNMLILDTSEIQARKPDPHTREISRLTWASASIPQNAIPFTVHGKPYVLEPPLKADFAFVKAWRGDRAGNLVYRKTARNFNPVMATAAAVTIAEVEHLVEPGELDPDQIVTPGIFVRHILQGSGYEKRIEKRTVRRKEP